VKVRGTAQNGVPQGGGKEELRAALLKPYLLRLRAEKGEKAVRALLATAGLPGAILENETAWISVAAARRAITALELALGREAIARRGEWMVHPENLGTYVRLLRSAARPVDAYRQLCDHAQESTRVGTYELEELGQDKVKITYRPIEGDDPFEPDELLSLAREAELAGIPSLWGLEEATIEHTESTGKGDPASVYLVAWKSSTPKVGVTAGAAAGAVLSALPALVAGSWIAGGVAGLVGGTLGGAVGYFYDKMRAERAARAFEKNRIAALERGLALKGELSVEAPAPGELDGTVLGGKYKILRKIGSGGIGVVYSAQHVTLGSTVAVKVLRGAAARDASEIARLRREAQVQVTIEHPNVVRTLDLDQMPDGSIYVVMELLRGHTLADKLMREGPVAPGFAIPCFRQVCQALFAAHAKGVIHRDLKPGNIFLCEDGETKVLDFGMSKFNSAESLTQEGYTLGTPEYMAPEQCIGAAVEPRTDLYAFGVLMYEALTGELPIQAQNRRDLLDLHQRQVPTTMRVRRPELPIPEMLDYAVMSCLKKRIADRPKDARELEKLLGVIPTDGLPVSYPASMGRVAMHDHGSFG
jgi:eukaryotic-like serine/threonine-protein kinase